MNGLYSCKSSCEICTFLYVQRFFWGWELVCLSGFSEESESCQKFTAVTLAGFPPSISFSFQSTLYITLAHHLKPALRVLHPNPKLPRLPYLQDDILSCPCCPLDSVSSGGHLGSLAFGLFSGEVWNLNSSTILHRMGFPGGTSGKEPACQCRRHKRRGFDPWVGKIPCRRAWQPTPGFLPGESPWTEEPGGLQSTGSHRAGHF